MSDDFTSAGVKAMQEAAAQYAASPPDPPRWPLTVGMDLAAAPDLSTFLLLRSVEGDVMKFAVQEAFTIGNEPGQVSQTALGIEMMRQYLKTLPKPREIILPVHPDHDDFVRKAIAEAMRAYQADSAAETARWEWRGSDWRRIKREMRKARLRWIRENPL